MNLFWFFIYSKLKVILVGYQIPGKFNAEMWQICWYYQLEASYWLWDVWTATDQILKRCQKQAILSRGPTVGGLQRPMAYGYMGKLFNDSPRPIFWLDTNETHDASFLQNSILCDLSIPRLMTENMKHVFKKYYRQQFSFVWNGIVWCRRNFSDLCSSGGFCQKIIYKTKRKFHQLSKIHLFMSHSIGFPKKIYFC